MVIFGNQGVTLSTIRKVANNKRFTFIVTEK